MISTTVMESRTKVSKPATKSKRVRTGCLTCRERHLKCDEAAPVCLNCRKGNRNCRRGIRLNFLQVDVCRPRYLAFVKDWDGDFEFQDESRQIASEYRGGMKRYPSLEFYELQERKLRRNQFVSQQLETPISIGHGVFGSLGPRPLSDGFNDLECQSSPPNPDKRSPHSRNPPEVRRRLPTSSRDYLHFRTKSEVSCQTAPPSLGVPLTPFSLGLPNELPVVKEGVASDAYQTSDGSSASIMPQVTIVPPNRGDSLVPNAPPNEVNTPPAFDKPPNTEREYLGSPEEVHFMQVFVEEVGVWMDSFDKEKHFSQLTPYQALKSPMLLNTFLACGVKHLSVGEKDMEHKSLCYFNTATTQLLRSLQNPDRNTAECATAAVVLHVYEIMSDIPPERMIHIAGARALIRECGWNATSTGIGSACFWLNIGMEVLNCLAMNWQTTWEPDHWGVDMELGRNQGEGHEEMWVRRVFCIMAKVANFKATAPDIQLSSYDEQILSSKRHLQWQQLRQLCHEWNNACPRTMHPIGYLGALQMKETSRFPKVWLIKRSAVLGQLFYHTTQCILCQINPIEKSTEEMHNEALHHAHQVCGIVAHTKDRGISTVAIRSLAIAGTVITDPKEREEILGLLERINRTSGWGLKRAETELKKGWGWEARPARIIMQMGMANPLSSADFSLPNHPYQNWYEPPNRGNVFSPPLN